MHATHTLKSFATDDRGAIAIIFALSAMVLFMMTGIAIDSSRAFNVSTKVQNALDASALAAAKLLDQDQNASDQEIIDQAQTIFDSYADNLRAAGTTLVNFVATPDRNESTVETQVDVSVTTIFGRLANIQPTLDFTPATKVRFKARKIELALVLDITGSMTSGGKLDGLKTAAKDLVDAMFANNPSYGAIRLAMVPYAGSVNAGQYASSLSGGASADNCVVERGGVSAYTNETAAPNRYMGVSDSGTNPSYGCPVPAIEPLIDLSNSTDRTQFKGKIEALVASGNTAGHIGAAIGWYMLSPNWGSFWPIQPRDYDPENVVKAIVLMTDGMFNTSYEAATSEQQAQALCDNMRVPANTAEAITIFTVGFQAPAAAETMLKACSGDANYYDANNNTDLIEAFRDIAEKLTSLRVAG